MSLQNYSDSLVRYADLGFSLDLSLMDIEPSFYEGMSAKIDKAFADIAELEGGAIANPDEGRMVGHYWLRNAELAPTDELKAAITEPLADLKAFAAKVHSGEVAPPTGGKFEQLLLIGIGGSALGPQLVAEALGKDADLPIYFFDNTDPAGMDEVIEEVSVGGLDKTLAMVISKSGGTPETRNGMLEAEAAYQKAGLAFGPHAIAITGGGSKLDGFADEHQFIAKFFQGK